MRTIRSSVAATLLVSLLAAVTVMPAFAVADLTLENRQPEPSETDLAPALADDGTFLGSDGVSGTIDTAAWTLVSDLASGEPPRFEPAGTSPAVPDWSAFGLNGAGASQGASGVGPEDVEWSALGSNGAGNGALGSAVIALAASAGHLYAGGSFSNAAGIPEADYVARWDGNAWSALGSNGAGNGPLNSPVFALAMSGTNVYVGGGFFNAVGIPEADYLALWNGSAWSALGSNGAANGALNGSVGSLVVSGAVVYVGGSFTNVAGVAAADYLARWSGSAWSALGSNGSGNGALNAGVGSLAVSGSSLYVGGSFT